MITINNIPLSKKEYETKKLPAYYNADDIERSKNGEEIKIKGDFYSLSIPSFGNSKNDFYEKLLEEHMEYSENDSKEQKGFEATALIYKSMYYDWYFHGIDDSFFEEGNLRFVMHFEDDESNDKLTIETDVLEYGHAIAIEIIKMIRKEKGIEEDDD